MGSVVTAGGTRLTSQFRGSVVTSDAGLLAYRELDDALGLSDLAGERLSKDSWFDQRKHRTLYVEFVHGVVDAFCRAFGQEPALARPARLNTAERPKPPKR